MQTLGKKRQATSEVQMSDEVDAMYNNGAHGGVGGGWKFLEVCAAGESRMMSRWNGGTELKAKLSQL